MSDAAASYGVARDVPFRDIRAALIVIGIVMIAARVKRRKEHRAWSA